MPGFRASAKTMSGRESCLDGLEFFGVCAGIDRTSNQASTSRTGSVPGSVSGTGRAPTMYSF